MTMEKSERRVLTVFLFKLKLLDELNEYENFDACKSSENEYVWVVYVKEVRSY